MVPVPVVSSHWSARASGYFEVGGLMGMFAFSPVGTVGPSTLLRLPVLKLVAYKRPLQMIILLRGINGLIDESFLG